MGLSKSQKSVYVMSLLPMWTTHCTLLPSLIGFLGTLAKCAIPMLQIPEPNVFTSQYTLDTSSHLLLSHKLNHNGGVVVACRFPVRLLVLFQGSPKNVPENMASHISQTPSHAKMR